MASRTEIDLESVTLVIDEGVLEIFGAQSARRILLRRATFNVDGPDKKGRAYLNIRHASGDDGESAIRFDGDAAARLPEAVDLLIASGATQGG